MLKNKKKEEKKNKENIDTTVKEEEVDSIANVKSVKISDDFQYVIELYDIWGSNTKRLPRFGAKRLIEGGNVYLFNKDKEFKEPMPQDTDEYKQYSLEKIEEELEDLEDKKDNTKNVSDLKDIEQDIKHLERHKSSIELQGTGSYIIFDEDSKGGKPIISFDRVGNFKLPIYKNIDKSLLYTPNEANIAEASDLLKENLDKNGNNDNGIKLVTLALIAFLLIAICTFGYMTYKTGQNSAERSVNDALLAEHLIKVSENLDEATGKLNNITKNIEPEVSPDTTVTPNKNNIN